MQRVREHVRRGLAPRHQLAVVPDEAVAVGHRHRCNSALGKTSILADFTRRSSDRGAPNTCVHSAATAARRAACGSGIDARLRRALQAHLVLQPAVLAIGIGRGRARGRQAAARARRQCASSAMLPALRVSSGCACACASTRNCTANSMSTMPPGSCLRSNSALRFGWPACILLAHLDDVGGELGRIARQAQDRVALGLERRADARVAGDEARARQRLVLPRPRRARAGSGETRRGSTPAGRSRRRAAGAGRCRTARPPRSCW